MNVVIMMFNGLLMCTDSDSDFAKDSVCGSSGSPTSSCPSARAHYYENKLHATLQILQNKEEEVRVQAETLTVAEERISDLQNRNLQQKKELEQKECQLQCLRKTLEKSKKEKTDACHTTKLPDTESQQVIVTTLENNLCVIEDLYRECFYETVKQENLIEMLRKSYLDVRLMDKEKCDQISKLHNVINTQKWSLDRCQDIASEVDSLKMEISNFLNNSNNDSGVWEESLAGGVNDDLQDIAAQLLRLRDLLTGDCTCGLAEENERLKSSNEELRIEVDVFRTTMRELSNELKQNNSTQKQYEEQLQLKDEEIQSLRSKVSESEEEARQQMDSCKANCCTLSQELSQVKELLAEKSCQLTNAHDKCEELETTIRYMKDYVDKAEGLAELTRSLREELSTAAGHAAALQRRVTALERDVTRARAHSEHIEECYREQATSTLELEAQLDAAHGRGAALCAEARRALAAVRAWAHRARLLHREQEEHIKQKESELRVLEQQLNGKQSRMSPTVCFKGPCAKRSVSCTLIGERQRYPSTSCASEMDSTFSTNSPCKCTGEDVSSCSRLKQKGRTSASEKEPRLSPNMIECECTGRAVSNCGRLKQKDAECSHASEKETICTIIKTPCKCTRLADYDSSSLSTCPTLEGKPRSASCHKKRREDYTCPSASEMEPTCSKNLKQNKKPSGVSPVFCKCVPKNLGPLKRVVKKESTSCVIRTQVRRLCPLWGPIYCETSVQHPVRRDAACSASPPAAVPTDYTTLQMSAAEQMFSRMESISQAASDAHRRWTKTRRH